MSTTNKITAIINARVFDGEQILTNKIVVIEGKFITGVGSEIPEGADIVDAEGETLLPGLIDSHVHTNLNQMRLALIFGVTTELEMMGYKSLEMRQAYAEMDDVADVRSAGFGLSVPGGHPSELIHPPRKPGEGPPAHVHGHGPPREAEGGNAIDRQFPSVKSSSEVPAWVAGRIAEGADYIKIMIEEGSMLGAPGLPMLPNESIIVGVKEAHKHGKLALAHALTLSTTQQAIAAGIDGLTHIFMDQKCTPEIIASFVASGAFVTPCLVLNSSIMGRSAAMFAGDSRVKARLTPPWNECLNSSYDTYPQGNFNDVLDTVRALHEAGVDLLVGTDASYPMKHLGGVAHGASVHHELQMLVQAGLTPIQALRAATSLPARRFALGDRGRIAVGYRADLLLVDGDPTTHIYDTLNIRNVWRRGVLQSFNADRVIPSGIRPLDL